MQGFRPPEFLVTPLMMGSVCLYLAGTGLKSQSAPDKTSQLLIWFGERPCSRVWGGAPSGIRFGAF